MTPTVVPEEMLFSKRGKILKEGDAEKLLKNHRYSRGYLKAEVDTFISVLPDLLQEFAEYRYKQLLTMEKTAEKMGYSTRNVYFFRKKLLKKWILYLNDIP